jgi:hypothetical protein
VCERERERENVAPGGVCEIAYKKLAEVVVCGTREEMSDSFMRQVRGIFLLECERGRRRGNLLVLSR